MFGSPAETKEEEEEDHPLLPASYGLLYPLFPLLRFFVPPRMNHIIKQKMESQEFVQVATLTFRSALQPDPDAPPAAFYDVSAQVQAVPGARAVYFGQQMERPDHWTWAVRWASDAALDAFLASPSFTGWLADFRALADSYIFTKALLRGDAAAALAAPCTEVFTAYGCSPDWLDARMKPFANNVNAARLGGLHGSAYGQFDLLAQGGVEAPAGITVSFILGWDSKATHMGHRGEGKLIDNNIHYVRDDRKSVDMYHVMLKRL
ncbi:dimeric alpha-beta barrel [Purpureocillium lavendulum]|uniref:Dimeric alpha-beta barrel n=1 Tax=Purpureocillium lavendulum TaxID=1247861 RepID=A0AB34G6L9_9HYPO|nr:dimeric alpha-beta barrel [Purpureocillium lavendulum]